MAQANKKTTTNQTVTVAPATPTLPAAITAAEMVALANATHNLGTVVAAYHGGSCPCLAKTQVPVAAANLVRAFVAKYPNAKVVATGTQTNYGARGKAGGKRHTIVAAILAGGSVAKIIAICKANGASFGGLADLVVLIWLGAVTLTK